MSVGPGHLMTFERKVGWDVFVVSTDVHTELSLNFMAGGAHRVRLEMVEEPEVEAWEGYDEFDSRAPGIRDRLVKCRVLVDVDDAPHLVIGEEGVLSAVGFLPLTVAESNGVFDDRSWVASAPHHVTVDDVRRKGLEVISQTA